MKVDDIENRAAIMKMQLKKRISFIYTSIISLSATHMTLPLTDDYAAIAPRISGGLSALSSSLIIFIIARSEPKLTTIYHRIMFGMSCADILGSVAMGLTTLPMPSELQEGDEDINYAGTRLGNEKTCQVQGFFVNFGLMCMLIYNGSLCFYYACIIAFRMGETTVKCKVEPFLHIVPVASALVLALHPLIRDTYRATGYTAWCFTSAIHSKKSAEVRIVIISLLPLTMFTCLLLVVRKVRIIQRELKSIVPSEIMNEYNFSLQSGVIRRTDMNNKRSSKKRFDEYSTGANDETAHSQCIDNDEIAHLLRQVKQAHQNSKVVFLQALAYIISFLVVLSGPLINSIIENYTIMRISAFLVPLQGFFNVAIFVSHKIWNYRRVNKNISRCDVFKLLLKGSEEPVLLSRISLVHYDRTQRRINLLVEDENEKSEIQLNMSGSGMNVQTNEEESDDRGLSGFDTSQKSPFGSMDDAGLSFSNASRNQNNATDFEHSGDQTNSLLSMSSTLFSAVDMSLMDSRKQQDEIKIETLETSDNLSFIRNPKK